jgi:hypothetical protein
MDLIQIEVTSIGSVMQVAFVDANATPPFRLENFSQVPILFHQKGLTISPYVLQPGSVQPYTWDSFSAV